MSSSSSSSGGVGLFSLLGVVFVTLKLLGYITWSWWWVTVPFWGGFVILIGIILAFVFGAGAIAGIITLWNSLTKGK